MATRRPLLLTLIRTERGSLWAQFRDGEKLFTEEAIKERIAAENAVTEGDISINPIELTIYSPDVHDVILIDLPGFVIAPERHQAEDLPEQIMKMNEAYMNDPSNILAVVTPATNDPAGSMALREAFKADRQGNRSLGIVTKIDLMSKQATSMDALLRLLRNEVHPMGMGRIGIRCRTHQEQVENVSFKTVEKREATWIDNSGLSSEPVRLGVPVLKKVLSQVLVEQATKELPQIIERLDEKIAEARHNESFLQRLAAEPEMRTVAKELETLVNQLHPAADSRIDYEQGLRANIFQCVDGAVRDASDTTFFTPSDSKYNKHPFELTGETRLISYEGNERDSVARPQAASVLHALGYAPEKTAQNLEPRNNISLFRDLMVYSSEANLDMIPRGALLGIRDRGVEIGAIAAYFKHSFPTNMRRARTAWSQRLGDTIDMLAGTEEDGPRPTAMEGTPPNDRVVGDVFNVFMGQLRKFADEVQVGGRQGEHSDLARAYFKFLLEKIAIRIRDEKLRAEMQGILERERRPLADFLDIQNELAKAKKLPTPVSRLFFGYSDQKEICDVEMFNEEWTRAYLRVLTKRVSDDMFRIMAVRLLEPLIFECIQFSLNLFNSNSTVIREAKLATKDADELEDLKRVLQSHLNTHQSEPAPAEAEAP